MPLLRARRRAARARSWTIEPDRKQRPLEQSRAVQRAHIPPRGEWRELMRQLERNGREVKPVRAAGGDAAERVDCQPCCLIGFHRPHTVNNRPLAEAIRIVVVSRLRRVAAGAILLMRTATRPRQAGRGFRRHRLARTQIGTGQQDSDQDVTNRRCVHFPFNHRFRRRKLLPSLIRLWPV